MTLVFETHATSLDNEAQLASGWFDVVLSSLGEQQARELGERRRHTSVVAVYCSDLRRAWDTAVIAFSGTDVPILRDERLRECNYGTMTRRPTQAIDAQRVAAVQTPFPDGESYEEVTNRVASWLCDALEKHGDASILVIGHRATWYALEHLCRGRDLVEVVTTPWRWQPGWQYHVAQSLSRDA